MVKKPFHSCSFLVELKEKMHFFPKSSFLRTADAEAGHPPARGAACSGHLGDGVGWKRDEYEGLVLAVGDGAIRLASRPFNSISESGAYGLERVVEYASTTESMLCNKALIVSRHKEATNRFAAFFLLFIFIFLLPE